MAVRIFGGRNNSLIFASAETNDTSAAGSLRMHALRLHAGFGPPGRFPMLTCIRSFEADKENVPLSAVDIGDESACMRRSLLLHIPGLGL